MKPPAAARIPLPIDALLPEALRSLEQVPNLVLQASPGTGKTTRVPPALLGASFRRPEQEIWVLEPRRLAAKWAAVRVAEDLGESPGRTVGYQFRFENVGSAATRLRFLTEGMLMRKLLADPELKRVAAVVLDEFHERHLHSDIALGYLRELQRTRRPELRLIVMSATLDTEALTSFLGDPGGRGACPVLKIEARLHPVTIEHLPTPSSRPLELAVRDAAREALAREGDVLVFLPGMGEIRRAADALSSVAGSGTLVLPLHGELTREEQDRAIRPIPGKRKIILSTNVAETSLTIEGITTVIDSGLHRQASYSWWSGMPALKTRPISRASAIQRAGRAGRTAPGRCLRLYTQGDFASRVAFDTPEVRRADISQTALELLALGIRDVFAFGWFEAPSRNSLEAAQLLLHRLGAVGTPASEAALTPLGRRLAGIPAHPRLARLLVEAERTGVLEQAATLAALIGEGELDRLDALECLRGAGAIPSVRRAATQLLSAFGSGSAPGGARAPEHQKKSEDDRLRFAVLAGFPDRVARKKPKAGISPVSELLFSSGGSGKVDETGSVTEHEHFVALDVQEQQGLGQARSQVKVRSLCPIRPEWLFDLEPSPLKESEEVLWDAERRRVVSVSSLRYDELVLDEDRGVPRDLEAAARVLLKQALGTAPEALLQFSPAECVSALAKATGAEAAESIEAAIARLELLRTHFPDFGIPAFSPALLLEAVKGKFALSELAELDWPREILEQTLARSAPQALGRLEELVPSTIQLPSGRRARVQYRLGQPPWVESRLQDFFGMSRGPAILGGRLALTLHLLAPNQRAVQITTDLAGFWERGYPELRTALSRRYPRHAWPENPRIK
ncbi:MAG: ATP-dependent helicase HrpB [Oligoflexia bacterium]|nr:ATP-dependent helicase HrpB [Oligoflexia bacterium]